MAEKECKVIVMLTKCVEGTERKCEAYFPSEEGDEMQVCHCEWHHACSHSQMLHPVKCICDWV